MDAALPQVADAARWLTTRRRAAGHRAGWQGVEGRYRGQAGGQVRRVKAIGLPHSPGIACRPTPAGRLDLPQAQPLPDELPQPEARVLFTTYCRQRSALHATDIDGGKMDGFVTSAEQDSSRGCSAANPAPSVCLLSSPPDVMGYHDAREIPNYWTYAEDFILDDHMFEPVAS